MRSIRSAAAAVTLLAAASILDGPPPRAEVTAVLDPAARVIGTLEITDREPTPWLIWSPFRAGISPSLLLNPDGDLYLDGPPSIVMNPTTGLPEAVWSYWDGADYEIAWSRFDGITWTTVQTPAGPDYQFLTDDALQDLDPRFWIDQSGNRRVVWWRSGGSFDEVVVSVLPAGETQWWAPQRVSTIGVPTRHPDIRTFGLYGTFIAAEEDNAGNLSVVVFDSPTLDGHTPQRDSEPWGRKRVSYIGPAPTPTLGVALGGLAAAGGEQPFITWRQGSSLATSLYDTEALIWAAPSYSPYPVW